VSTDPLKLHERNMNTVVTQKQTIYWSNFVTISRK